MNMKGHLNYETRKKETVSYTKIIGAFFASMNITILWLINPDVYIKIMHQLYILHNVQNR